MFEWEIFWVIPRGMDGEETVAAEDIEWRWVRCSYRMALKIFQFLYTNATTFVLQTLKYTTHNYTG